MFLNRKAPSNIIALWLIALLLIACQLAPLDSTASPAPTAAATFERAEQLEFKGIELYSWQAETGEWVYSILPGTNRNKTIAEVKVQPLSFDEVKAAISKLAIGETIFWFNRTAEGSSGPGFDLAYPPHAVIAELEQVALIYQVKLIGAWVDPNETPPP